MSDIRIKPNLLKGNVIAPPSKSAAHRHLICAALCNGVSIVHNIVLSQDIKATINALKSIGADVIIEDDIAIVKGICRDIKNAEINCFESGSTLRFMIPVVAALGIDAVFKGKGRLPERPITPYLTELTQNGISFSYNNIMPFSFSGKLKAGKYYVDGNISSQFITGLMLALPLLDGDSDIILKSPLQSEPYINLTISILNKYDIEIIKTEKGYYIKGNQKFISCNSVVEGDYSQAAFFYVANALGCDINISGLEKDSNQGDKKIVDIISNVSYNICNNVLKPFDIDGQNIPDIVPILAVLACFCDGTSYIRNVARLRIKESDRLKAITDCINNLGGFVKQENDILIINGVNHLDGGVVESFNDHRIAMSAAIAAIRCKNNVIIKNAECVKKSYPDFFEVYNTLGGKADVINME